jgi:hypothetical protein
LWQIWVNGFKVVNLKRVLLSIPAAMVFLVAASQVSYQDETRKFLFSGTGTFEITGSDSHSLSISYSLPELSLKSHETTGGTFFRLAIPGHHMLSDTGRPELPVITKLINVPDYSDVKVRYTNIQTITIRPETRGVRGRLMPSQPPLSKSQRQQQERFVMDAPTYTRNEFSRRDTLLVEYTGNLRGHRLATLTFIPARYNPVKNELEVITSAEITISFVPAAKSQHPATQYEPPDKIKSFTPDQLINGFTDKPAGMVILSDTTFRTQLEPLIRWKNQKGFRVSVIYRGETLAGTTFTQLKDTLSRVYNSSPEGYPPPEYLLIVGDASKIPRAEGTTYLSDLYYGEFTGDGDYLPEMYIGRIPAKDTADVRSAVSKILMYERQEFADTNSFFLITLITAGNDAGHATYMNGHVNYASSYYLNEEQGLNPVSFNYPVSYNMDDSVKLLLNRGLAFMNYTGHGAVSRWEDPTFTNIDAAALSNTNMYPFIVSNACLTGMYNSTTSLAATLILGRDKGAIGFIGCTTDSYWDEDYYYAIGAGDVTLNPLYSPDELGFYDRLFHTNGELPSEWFFTMGHVNFAGLLAVTQSSSTLKKRYWETYALLGDPSLIPVIGTQEIIPVNLPDTIPYGIRTLYITAPPFTYAAVSDHDSLWDASYVSPSGYAQLSLPEMTGDSCMVVITGQGRKPFVRTLYFGDSEKAWLSADSFTINDASENNNGKADYGETLYLGMKISNLGNETSSDTYIKIRSESEWVTILSDSASIGEIPAKTEVTIDKVFTISIGSNIPDQGIISFVITVANSESAADYVHDIIVQSPFLSIVSLRFDDSSWGNGNGLPDRGETLNFVFSVNNSGSSDAVGIFRLTDISEGISLQETVIGTGLIPPGETIEIEAVATISPLAAPGTRLSLESTVDCGFYSNNRQFDMFTGKIKESFEYGNFDLFPWIISETTPWIITETDSYDGIKSATSGTISNSSSSTLRISIDIPETDTLKFWYKVSSEPNYDFLRFLVNGEEVFKVSGEQGWTQRETILSPGVHLLEWIYSKDGSKAVGLDRAWIDMISFPESAFATRDIGLASLESPALAEEYGEEPVTVLVKNLGNSAINGFFLAYTVEETNIYVSEYFPGTIPYRDSLTVTFGRTLDLSRYGFYNITVYSFNNGDDFLYNDTIRLMIDNTRIREDIRAYPNPFSDQIRIFISSPEDDEVEVTVTSASGRKMIVTRHPLSEGDNTITIRAVDLPPGVYVLSIKGYLISKRVKVLKI